MPNVETITTDFTNLSPPTIWSQDGAFIWQSKRRKRQPITLDQIRKNVLDATIAAWKTIKLYEQS
jgi:membrane carboxypeptidase/penicillin-binding protein